MGSIGETEQQLKALRKKDLQLRELLDHCASFIPLFAGKQIRYKVSDLPNQRTIRYYVKEGLMDRPLRKGRRSIFSYRHLLQVLVVKRLQSRYFPLKKIAEIMQGLSDPGLEKILTAESVEKKLLTSPTPPPRLSSSVFPSADNQVRHRPFSSALSSSEYTSWRKYRINDRLELHVEEQFDLFDPLVDPEMIATRIMHVLSKFSTQGKDWNAYEEASPTPIEGDDRLCALPAPPVANLSDAVVVLITEGGLVPKGNPDQLEAARASRFLKYNIAGIEDLKSDAFESVDRGWDVSYVNADPDRLLPLDVMRELERKKVIHKTHEYFYTTTGVAMSVDTARKIGKAIGAELKREEVSAAILTAT